MDFMNEREIQSRTFFYPLHMQPAFAEIVSQGDVRPDEFPNSKYAYEHGVCLPAFPELSEDQVIYTVDVIKEFYAGATA
jgi:perosamine synthetase